VGFVLRITLATGLLMRAFFDTLSGEAPVSVGVWTLIALLIGSEAVRIGVFCLGMFFWFTFWFGAEALLRGNLFTGSCKVQERACCRTRRARSLAAFAMMSKS
jgi:hypothetical protein